MAKKKRRYTRKQLKQPDLFVSRSQSAIRWVREHATGVAIMLGVAALVVAGASLWNHYATRRATKATRTLGRALDMYNQTIIPSAKQKSAKTEDNIPRFSSRDAKLQATDKELTELIDKDGVIARMAELLRAGDRYDQGKYDEAIADYKRYLASSPSGDRWRKIAIEGLIYSHEQRKQWKQALQAVKRLPKKGQDRWVALYHRARLLAAKGDTKGAIKAFRRVVDKASSKLLIDQAGERLAMLELK